MPKFVKGQPRPANAGRKKGTQNRATIERNKAKDEAMNAEANESPGDYMLRIMRSPSADPARRDAMALACAPYVHAQLQAVAHQPATGLGWTPTSTRGRPPLGARPMTAVRAQQAVSPAADAVRLTV